MILRDLNLNPTNESEKRLLELLCGKEKKNFLNEITTNQYNQLDHIIGEKSLEKQLYTTSFFNFISDHKSITARIGIDGNEFAKEFLQKINFNSDKHTKPNQTNISESTVISSEEQVNLMTKTLKKRKLLDNKRSKRNSKKRRQNPENVEDTVL